MQEFGNQGQENLTSTETDTVESKDVVEQQPEEEVVEPKQPEVKEQEVEKTFTQKQVNDLIKARLERRANSLFKRYGVANSGELDELIGKSQSYDVMKERYGALKDENSQLKERLAFLSNGINPEREDDVRAHFKGKGIDFNEESLKAELQTHPEWLKIVEDDPTPKTTITKLGFDHKDNKVPESEAEKMNRIFGV